MLGRAPTEGVNGGGGPGGPPLVVLEKLELGPGAASVISTLRLLYQISRSRPWRIRMSIASALEACAMVWKNWMVLEKRPRRVRSSTNLPRVGSL